MFKSKISRILLTVTALMSLALTCFAETTVADMTTAFTGIQTTILSAIGAIAPVALIVAGAFLAWRYGLRFFKSVSK